MHTQSMLSMTLVLFLVAAYSYCAESNLDDLHPQDVVILKDGTNITLHIEDENFLYVSGVVPRTGKRLRLVAGTIQEIRYAGWPVDYSEGLERLKKARFTSAALSFLRALEEPQQAASPQKLQELCCFLAGEGLCLSENYKGYSGKAGRRYDPPGDYFARVLALAPRSRLAPEAVLRRMRCLLHTEPARTLEVKVLAHQVVLEPYLLELRAAGGECAAYARRLEARMAALEACAVEQRAQAALATWEEARDAWRRARELASEFTDLACATERGILRAADAARDAVVASDNRDTDALLARAAADDPAGARSEAERILATRESMHDGPSERTAAAAALTLSRTFLQQGEAAEHVGCTAFAWQKFAEARWTALQVAASCCEDDLRVAQAYRLASACAQHLEDIEPEAHSFARRYEWLAQKTRRQLK